MLADRPTFVCVAISMWQTEVIYQTASLASPSFFSGYLRVPVNIGGLESISVEQLSHKPVERDLLFISGLLVYFALIVTQVLSDDLNADRIGVVWVAGGILLLALDLVDGGDEHLRPESESQDESCSGRFVSCVLGGITPSLI